MFKILTQNKLQTLPLMSLAFGSSLTLAWLIIDLACFAYLSVLSVSSTWKLDGPIVASIAVFELPPRLSFSNLSMKTIK